MRRRPFVLSALACLAALTVVPAGAGAEVREGQGSDPVEQAPDLNGASRIPDFESVRVSFDYLAGAVTATVRFNQAVDYTNPGHRLYVGLGRSHLGGLCSAADVLIGADVTAAAQKATYFVSGFTGAADGTASVSGDKHEMTLAFTNPKAARVDLRCFSAYTQTYDPVGHCGNPDCSQWSNIWVHDSVETTYFNGFAPKSGFSGDVPACQDGLDNDGDGKVDIEADPGCRGKPNLNSEADPKPVASRLALTARRAACGVDVQVALGPDLEPSELFPTSRVIVRVRGVSGAGRRYSRTRRLSLLDEPASSFADLRVGRYRVSARYRGDRWRKAAVRSRLVTVRGHSCRR